MICGIGGTVQNITDACKGDSGGAYVRQVSQGSFLYHSLHSYCKFSRLSDRSVDQDNVRLFVVQLHAMAH